MEQDFLVLLGALLAIAGGVGFVAQRAKRSQALRGQTPAPSIPSAPPKSTPFPVPAAGKGQAKALPRHDTTEEEATAAFQAGLEKTRSTGFVAKLGALFKGKAIDASMLGQLEEVLFTADIGVKTSHKIFEDLRSKLSRNELTNVDALWERIRQVSRDILNTGAPPLDLDRTRPFVILMVGVNGVGKTTTMGKLAARYTQQGKRVLLAAGDTFRAAAVEQLEIWGQRTGCPVVRGKDGGDPSSVIFEATKRAQTENFDVLICDTAGRLHTKTELMEELKKVRRVTEKALPGAPHETLLVVDSTTGQNAIAQAKLFTEAVQCTGLVLTKLDGTAKGGVVLGICDELQIPVRYIGIGEKVEDLREFCADDFIKALYSQAPSERAA